MKNDIENEILKFRKQGFEIIQRKTLKFGKRIVLRKAIMEGIVFFGYKYVYIYYVTGDSTNDNILECLKDYIKYWKNTGFTERDKAYFILSGFLDKKWYSMLKKEMIDYDDMRKFLKVKSLGTKKILTIEDKKTREIHLNEVISFIENIPFLPSKKERIYEAQLYTALHSRGYSVTYESQRRGSRFDLVLGDDKIAIEIKIVPNANVFIPLLGQVMKYKRQFEKIIVVLIDQFKNPSIINKEIEELEKIENVKAILK